MTQSHHFKRVEQGREYRLRPKRYTPIKPMNALVRSRNTRFCTFWMKVGNFSAAGFLLKPTQHAFIPFAIGTELEATIDLHLSVFARPLHMTLKVMRIDHNAAGEITSFGVQILTAEERHIPLFWAGFEHYGPPNELE